MNIGLVLHRLVFQPKLLKDTQYSSMALTYFTTFFKGYLHKHPMEDVSGSTWESPGILKTGGKPALVGRDSQKWTHRCHSQSPFQKRWQDHLWIGQWQRQLGPTVFPQDSGNKLLVGEVMKLYQRFIRPCTGDYRDLRWYCGKLMNCNILQSYFQIEASRWDLGGESIKLEEASTVSPAESKSQRNLWLSPFIANNPDPFLREWSY